MIDFQPMPKRFMVWEKDYQQFARKVLSGGIREYVYTLPEMGFYYNDPDCIICQSTNLFDKDGKEIFEGSIVDFTYWQMAFTPDQERRRTIRGVIGCDSLGHYIQRIGGSIKLYLSNYANCYDNEAEFYKDFSMVGHILSNPELVEEK